MRRSAPVAVLLCFASAAALAEQARVALRWRDVPGASAYELQIAKDNAFVEVVLQTRTTTAGYKWEQLPKATHYWRVRSIDGEGRASEWSAPKAVAVEAGAASARSPDDSAVWPCGSPVSFVAEPSTMVKEYVLQISGTKDFASIKELRSKSGTFTAPLDAGTWYWRLIGLDLRDKLTEKSPVRTLHVKVAPPKLKPSGDSTPGGSATLSWAPSDCAASYLVEAWVEGGEHVTLPAPAQAQLSFKTPASGDYHFRVAGLDAQNRPGEWSPEQKLRSRFASPNVKGEAVLGRSAELHWEETPGAASYKVEVSARKDFKTVDAHGSATTGVFKTVPLEPGAWFWRVMAVDAKGQASPPSEPREFDVHSVEPLATPELFEPKDGASLLSKQPFMVSWFKVPEAEKYVLELDGVEFPPIASLTQRLAGVKDGPHYLRVRAIGAADRDSLASEARTFYVGVPKVKKAKVNQTGFDVEVVLFDEAGNPVEGARPQFWSKAGGIGKVTSEGGRQHFTWSPKDSGDATLVVRERDFKTELLLTEPTPPPFSVGAVGGFGFNFGAVSSLVAGANAGYDLPAFQRHVAVELRALAYGAAFDAPSGTARVPGSALLVPVEAMGAFRVWLGGFELKASAGFSLTVASLTVGSERDLTASPGVLLGGSVGRRVGSGLVTLEVQGLYSTIDSRLMKLNSGGLMVTFGYAFSLYHVLEP